jgi:hypothetical protein
MCEVLLHSHILSMVGDTLTRFHCHQNYIQMLALCQGAWLGIRVDMSTIEWYPIIEHFQVFSCFITKLKVFLCHWKRKIESDKCSKNLKSKGTSKKCKKRKSDILFQILSLDFFSYNNYILFISHSFWMISKATNAVSKDL